MSTLDQQFGGGIAPPGELIKSPEKKPVAELSVGESEESAESAVVKIGNEAARIVADGEVGMKRVIKSQIDPNLSPQEADEVIKNSGVSAELVALGVKAKQIAVEAEGQIYPKGRDKSIRVKQENVTTDKKDSPNKSAWTSEGDQESPQILTQESMLQIDDYLWEKNKDSAETDQETVDQSAVEAYDKLNPRGPVVGEVFFVNPKSGEKEKFEIRATPGNKGMTFVLDGKRDNVFGSISITEFDREDIDRMSKSSASKHYGRDDSYQESPGHVYADIIQSSQPGVSDLRFRGLGFTLCQLAVERSIQKGFDGRVQLSAASLGLVPTGNNAAAFYEDFGFLGQDIYNPDGSIKKKGQALNEEIATMRFEHWSHFQEEKNPIDKRLMKRPSTDGGIMFLSDEAIQREKKRIRHYPILKYNKSTVDALLKKHNELEMKSEKSTAPVEESFVSDPRLKLEDDEIILAERANYDGDWGEILHERLLHPSMQEKMDAILEENLDAYKEGWAEGPLNKDQNFQNYQKQHSVKFRERVKKAFTLTEIGEARDYGKNPEALGVTLHSGRTYAERFSHPGAVFDDAKTIDGKPLTVRQKNIIEAHEKGHAARDFSGAMADEIQEVIDQERLRVMDLRSKERNPNYVSDANEIIERMAQFKNYFGFRGNEVFTKAHLDYIRQHYIEDVGLDNGITDFLDAVTPKTEVKFLEIINKYPI